MISDDEIRAAVQRGRDGGEVKRLQRFLLEATVIEMRIGLKDGTPRTLDEVAQSYGITRERIRQIEARSLLKLRQPLRSQRLVGFAEEEKQSK